ncbi:TIR domain-containing protein [Rhodanobacter aciditrophus]|uniref:toll/interleukin-1 receptor domain-containing protein n=1 Tax=Rhodanobacter aciditrophus TaxID=1623218 RepID=UPI003CE9CA87
MAIPKVFVSYSHDSQEHKRWVLEFATRLRSNGVDAVLDQWELQPGDDLPHFMERHLSSADRILMICTDKYVAKANMGSGGVGYEKMIVTADLMKSIDSNKVVPIIRQNGTRDVPVFLRTKLFIDFSSEDQFEFSFDELVRTLHGAPLFVKPPIGNNPFTPASMNPPERTGDALLGLMGMIVSDYESHARSFTSYSDLVSYSGISRLMLDVLIADATREGLVELDSDGDVYLTDKGRRYALQHKLNR